MRAITVGWILVLTLVLAGCGSAPGGSSTPIDTSTPATDPIAGSSDKTEFNVTITTRSGPIYVDKLELEFNRRRGIHEFHGFFEDQIDRFATVSFSDLERIDILDPMSPSLFDQAILGREQLNLRRDQAFEVRLYYRDQTTTRFYAIIPKLRGERDFQLWELPMTNNAAGIEFIEFNR